MTGGYAVNVEAVPSRNLGGFTDEVVVLTDHPLEKEIHLTLGGKRTGPIDVVPETVRLSNVSPDEGASRTVMILVRNAPDTRIEVKKAPDNVKVEVVPADLKTGTAAKVRQYRMTVTVPPGTPTGLIQGTIVLSTDHPQAGTVRVPVDISVIGGF
jgi:hypothetical protein